MVEWQPEYSVWSIAVAQRILSGESVMALNAELKIKRSVLYRWRDAYRRFGQDGFKKTRGRPLSADSC